MDHDWNEEKGEEGRRRWQNSKTTEREVMDKQTRKERIEPDGDDPIVEGTGDLTDVEANQEKPRSNPRTGETGERRSKTPRKERSPGNKARKAQWQRKPGKRETPTNKKVAGEPRTRNK